MIGGSLIAATWMANLVMRYACETDRFRTTLPLGPARDAHRFAPLVDQGRSPSAGSAYGGQVSHLSIVSGGAGDNHALISPVTRSSTNEVWCFIPGPHNHFLVATGTELLGEQLIELETITVTTRYLWDAEAESPEFLARLLESVALQGIAADAKVTIAGADGEPVSIEMLLPQPIVDVLPGGVDHDVDVIYVSTFTAGSAVFQPDEVRVRPSS